MRNLIIAAIVAILPFCLIAQNQQPKGVFSDFKKTSVTTGSSFEINCSQSDAIGYYKTFMHDFKVKKKSATVFETNGLGGTVTTTITGTKQNAVIEILVANASFPNLALKFRCFIMSKMLSDTFRRQEAILKNMIASESNLRKSNVSLLKKVEKLNIEIANCQKKYELNSIAIDRYHDDLEPRQKAEVNAISEKIKEIRQFIATLPEK